MGIVPNSGNPGSADRAAVAQDHHTVLGDVEVGVVHTSREVVDVLEHERRAAVPEQMRRRGAALDHCAPRRQRTTQDDVRTAWLQR